VGEDRVWVQAERRDLRGGQVQEHVVVVAGADRAVELRDDLRQVVVRAVDVDRLAVAPERDLVGRGVRVGVGQVCGRVLRDSGCSALLTCAGRLASCSSGNRLRLFFDIVARHPHPPQTCANTRR
jgi:hypothetical protein